ALIEPKGADPAGWLLAAQLAIQKGAADDAMSALGKVFNDTNATEQQQLQAALLELALASGSEAIDARATDAWSRIEKISRGKSAAALDALVLLAQGIAQLKNGDANDLFALATWLNSKKEFEKTVEAIPLEEALLGRELFLQYLDALGGLERWGEIKQLLEGDRYPLDPVVQGMYLARCSAQLGEKAAAENNWQR